MLVEKNLKGSTQFKRPMVRVRCSPIVCKFFCFFDEVIVMRFCIRRSVKFAAQARDDLVELGISLQAELL
jgi:hypothetical protein